MNGEFLVGLSYVIKYYTITRLFNMSAIAL